jgi:hypothetical protein
VAEGLWVRMPRSRKARVGQCLGTRRSLKVTLSQIVKKVKYGDLWSV